MTTTDQNIGNTQPQGASKVQITNISPVGETNAFMAPVSDDGGVVLNKPEASFADLVNDGGGHSYVLNFSVAEVNAITQQGNTVTFLFNDGSKIVLQDYVEGGSSFRMDNGSSVDLGDLIAQLDPNAVGGEMQAELESVDVEAEVAVEEIPQDTQSGSDTRYLSEAEQRQADALAEELDVLNVDAAEELASVEDIANIEPAAGDDVANRLADIEPAAGDLGAPGSEGRGYGFNSSFAPQGVIPISAVGPIDPTALQYGIPAVQDDVLPEEELPAIAPTITLGDVQVLEDETVQLQVSAAPETGNGTLTITISGIPSTWAVTTTEGSYDATTGTWTHTVSGAYTGGPSLTTPADSDVDLLSLQVTVVETDPDTGRVGQSVGTIDVIVDAVADDPDVVGADSSGLEGATLAVDVPTALTGEEVNNGIGGDDGSESITSIVISPVDPTVDLNDFDFANAGGALTIDAASGTLILSDRSDLTSLTITPKDSSYVGSIDLTVTLNTAETPNDIEFNGSNDTAQDSDVLTLTWQPVANPPEVLVNGGADSVNVLEDGTAIVDVVGTLSAGGSGNEVLSLTISGIDLTQLEGGAAGFSGTPGPNGESWVRVAGTPDANASYTLSLSTGGTNYAGSFTFIPAADSDVDLTGMSVVASALEPSTSTTATSGADSFVVIVDAVADAVDIGTSDDSGAEGSTLDIVVTNAITGEEINNGVGGDDGSESITSIVIAPVDPTVDLNDFTITNAGGAVSLDASGHIVFSDATGLQNLQITPKDSGYSGSIDLTVTLNTAETPNDIEFNGSNDTAQDSDVLTLTWQPGITPPTIIVNGGVDDVQVKEDHSADVSVVANFAPGASASEYLTLSVTGLDLTKLQGGASGFTASDSTSGASWVRVAGTPDTDASYTIVLSPGEAYTGVFGFDPLDQSDLDLTGMSVRAVSTDASVSPAISASAQDGFNVIVDAVADDAQIVAHDNSGQDGAALAVDIDGALSIDTDGSETISGYQVRGDATEMDGFIFTVNGTARLPVGGVITLSATEYDSLVVTPKDSTWTGSLDLDAYIFNAESAALGAGEYDVADNTNSASDPFTLTWTDGSQPVVSDPVAKDVDESDFVIPVADQDSASGTIQVAFGNDVSGASITGNGTYDLSGATVGGALIAVVYDPALNTYTGTSNGLTIFTLVIDPAAVASDGNAWSSYKFTLFEAIDHPVAGDNSAGEHDDSLPFTFEFIATDSDGDTDIGTITINVFDDGLTANDDIVRRSDDFDVLTGDVITGAGNTVAGGADDLSEDDVDLTAPIQNKISEVEGVAIAAVGTTDIAGTYGVLSIAADGSYTYTLNPGENSEGVTESFEYTLMDGDNDISRATLTIEGLYESTPDNVQADSVVLDETDISDSAPVGETSASGSISADFGNDAPGIFAPGDATKLQFSGTETSDLMSNGVDVDVVVVGNSYVGTANGSPVFTLEIDANTGAYEFTLTGPLDHADSTDPNDVISLDFEVIATDSDGDSGATMLKVNILDDAPIANDDFNGFQVTQNTKDYNVVLVLDVSSSMSGEKLDLLKSSVSNLLEGLNSYSAGNVKVHIVPFSDTAQTAGTYSVSADAGYAGALDFVDNLFAYGATNYEAPLQSAISWLEGNTVNTPIIGAETYTYFISDGEPNRYIDASDQVVTGDADTAMDEIDGQTVNDTVSEIDQIQSLSEQVFSVGIGVNATTLDRLGEIASSGSAIDVQDPNDLEAALQSITPVVGFASGNVITGLNGGYNAADNLSEDDVDITDPIQNYVTAVNGVAVATSGSTDIVGTFGVLTISADGSYQYNLTDSSLYTTPVNTALNPIASDVSGTAEVLVKNGITVTASNSTDNDLTWVDTAQGSGIGIAGGDDTVFPLGETLTISADGPATIMQITIAELGDNDDDGLHGLDYVVTFADGSTQPGEQQFEASGIQNGEYVVTLDSTDFGGKLIASVDISSTDAGDYLGASFLLNNVDVTYNELSDVHDEFVYTLTDGDGDADTATLVIHGYSSNLITSVLGDETLYATSQSDTFLFDSLGDGTDTIIDFEVGEDVLDFSGLISGYDNLQDAIDDFVFELKEESGNTVISVDVDGQSGSASAVELVILDGITGVAIDDVADSAIV